MVRINGGLGLRLISVSAAAHSSKGAGMPTFREVAKETTSGLIRRQAAEIERLRAALARIRAAASINGHYSYVELCDNAVVEQRAKSLAQPGWVDWPQSSKAQLD